MPELRIVRVGEPEVAVDYGLVERAANAHDTVHTDNGILGAHGRDKWPEGKHLGRPEPL